jgi:gluconolactonase
MKPHGYLFALLVACAAPFAGADDKTSAASESARPEPPGPPALVAPGAQLVERFSGNGFYEGPLWNPRTNQLLFTAIGVKPWYILALGDDPTTASVWLDDERYINGTSLGNDGRLLGAQTNTHDVVSVSLEDSSDIQLLAHADDWNEPNDIIQAPNGDVYFTDPPRKDGKPPAVYLLRAGKVTRVIGDQPHPNGVQTSRDGKLLVVADSKDCNWYGYPINADGSVGKGAIFFDPGVADASPADGLTIDAEGNFVMTGRGGVWFVTPEGKPLGFVSVPVFATNVAYGGADGKTLYVTGAGKVFSLKMATGGFPSPKKN